MHTVFKTNAFDFVLATHFWNNLHKVS